VLAQIEAASPERSARVAEGARRVAEEARRGVALAEQLQGQGVRDAHRAGASLAELEATTRLPEATILAMLSGVP
jgi:hypothetical protein